MKFREFIRENKEVHHVFAFGRMSPPTTGHEVLVNKVKEVAHQVGGSHSIVLSHSQDRDKNPLSPQDKLKHAKRFFPKTNLSIATKESPSFLTHASQLHKQGVTHLHMVAGSDRVPEYERLLKKYNGKNKDSLFNFKEITVHNAGERDPDAEGTAGMSASKMRGHASKGEYKEFKKGIPKHVPEHHAREMYNDVRKGMQIKESVELNESFEELITEGVHDQGIFKAVFLAGGPGSGKDYVLDNTLSGHGLTEINSDKALEFLMDKNDLDKTMPATEKDKRDIVRGRAKNITELRQRLALVGRNGLIINGTGDDVEKITRIKQKLDELGYESSMLLVNTEDEVSKQRNIERGQRGGRTVPEEIRKEKWDNVQAGRPEFAKLFGQNYMEIDNSTDLRSADPETVKAKKDEMLQIFKQVQEFVSTPPQNPIADEWVAHELHKKDTLPVPKDGAEQIAHPDAGAGEEARKLGLQYYGFGRYGKNGEVTHRSVHGKLVEISKEPKPIPMQKVNESFEQEFGDNYSLTVTLPQNESTVELFEQKKTKLLRDKNGKPRVFMLRRSAAKEAHQNGGEVMKHPVKGYVIKIKEENYATISKEPILEKRDTNTCDCGCNTKGGKCKPTTVAEGNDTGSYESGNYNFTPAAKTLGPQSSEQGKGPATKTKITLQQIRTKQKEVTKESIDKGIEPGLSMAASGENLTRGVTKNRILKKPLDETIGAGGEDCASISDQKEGELKRKGISLSSFKSKKVV